MAKDNRSEYIVELGGVEHTFLLSEEDAERYPGARKGSAKDVAQRAVDALQATKAVTPQNK